VQKGILDIIEIIEDDIAANTAVNVFTSGGRIAPPFSCPTNPRTQFNSSLIASWRSNMQQTQAQSGSQPT